MKAALTRDELYELVWSEPIKNVAPNFGISDVALSKICRKHSIPRPPRGYWAKLAAGKPVVKASLPRRGIRMPHIVELSRKYRLHYPIPEDPEEIEIPSPPEFSESISDLEARVKEQVGKVTVPRDLREGHHLIRRLLEQDDERLEASEKRGDYSGFDEPLFGSPFEKRRLRLINAIFLSLGRSGVTAKLRGKDPDEFDFQVGE